MIKFIIPIAAGIALSVPAMAQDANHVRVGDRLYDIRTGSSDDGIVFTGPSQDGLELVRQTLVAAGCPRPDESDHPDTIAILTKTGLRFTGLLSTIMDGPKVTPLYAAMGTYSFSQHASGTCSHHGGVQRWD
jgi:hypothetical protein